MLLSSYSSPSSDERSSSGYPTSSSMELVSCCRAASMTALAVSSSMPSICGQILDGRVHQRIEIVVAGFVELRRPLLRTISSISCDVRLRRGTRAIASCSIARERVGDFALDFLFRLDVDLRADQLRGETDVQTALADGERELIVVDDDVEVRPVRHLVARSPRRA